MCYSCFINGDHRGHKFSLRKSGQGVCDCGDPDGLKPRGYCKDHKGHSTLEPGLSLEIINKFKSELLNLWIDLIYYSTYRANYNIKIEIYSDVLHAWNYLWEELSKGFKKNQNLLLLSLDVLTNSEELKKKFPENKLKKLIKNMKMKFDNASNNIAGNLIVLFGEEHEGIYYLFIKY